MGKRRRNKEAPAEADTATEEPQEDEEEPESTSTAKRRRTERKGTSDTQDAAGSSQLSSALSTNVYDELVQKYAKLEPRQVEAKALDEPPAIGGYYHSSQALNSQSAALPEDTDDEEEQEEEREYIRRPKEDPLFGLPADGSIFKDGLPFHHLTTQELKDSHYRRLERLGIHIKRSFFTKEEDDILRENWRTFAERYDIAHDEAPLYMGINPKSQSAEEHTQRLRFIRENSFRPWMCKGLLNRTAPQVFRRCYRIFHPSKLQEEAEKPWSEEEDSKLLRLYDSLGPSWEAIGQRLERMRFECRERHAFLTQEANGGEQGADGSADGTQDERKANATDDWTAKQLGLFYGLLSDLMARHPVLVATIPRYAKYEEKVDWPTIAKRLRRSPRDCSQKWAELKVQFIEARERLGSDFVRDVESEVLSEQVLAVGHRDESRAKRILLRMTPDSTADVIDILLEQEELDVVDDFDAERLERRIAELEMPIKVRNVGKKLVFRIKRLLFVCNERRLFDQLPKEHMSLEDKLELLAGVLRRASTFRMMKSEFERLARKHIRKKGWTPRKLVVMVDTAVDLHGQAASQSSQMSQAI